LLDHDDDVREFSLRKLEGEDPELYQEVAAKVRDMQSQPDWFSVPLGSEGSSQMVTMGSGLSSMELQFLLKRWNVYVSSSRSPLLIAHSFDEVSNGFAIDQCLRRLPIEFPEAPLDAGLELAYNLRKEGRLRGLREYLQQ